MADEEEQFGWFVDHVIEEVRQREARKQDRDAACDPNYQRCVRELPSRTPGAGTPVAKAGEEALAFSWHAFSERRIGRACSPWDRLSPSKSINEESELMGIASLPIELIISRLQLP